MNPFKLYNNALAKLYKRNDYPSDRYTGNPDALAAFTREFNHAVGQEFEPSAVADQLVRLRKAGRLAKLGDEWSGPTIF